MTAYPRPVEQRLTSLLTGYQQRIVTLETQSATLTPPNLQHNTLQGLQGGKTAEYYHLTAAEYAALPKVPTAYTFTYIQTLIDAAPTGSIVVIPPGTYTSDGASYISINRAMTIVGYGVTLTQTSAGAYCAFHLTGGGGVTIEGFKMVGPTASTTAGSRAIEVVGGAVGSEFNGLTVRDCQISVWGQYGIYLEFTNNFTLQNNLITNIGYGGIAALCCKYGRISDGLVMNVSHTSGSNSYGILISRYTTQAIALHPRSTDITCTNNVIYNVPLWEGLDTHSGQRIQFSNNVVLKCNVGIAVVGSKNEGGVELYGAQQVDCVGNVIDSLVTNGTAGVGIEYVGPTPAVGTNLDPTTGTITGNVISNHGTETSATTGGIILYGTEGVVVSGNRVERSCTAGVFLYHTNTEAVIVNNSIVDPWRNGSGTVAVGVWAQNNYNTGFVGGNNIYRGTLVGKATILTYGIRVTSNATNVINYGANRIVGYATNSVSNGALAVTSQVCHGSTLTFPSDSTNTVDFNVAAPRAKDNLVCGTAQTNASNGTTAVLIYSTALAANSLVLVSWAPTGGTNPVGTVHVYSRTSSYFSIKSTAAGDTSRNVSWMIVNPS